MEKIVPDEGGHRGFFKFLITAKIKVTIFPLVLEEKSISRKKAYRKIVCNYNQKGFKGFLGTFCSFFPPLSLFSNRHKRKCLRYFARTETSG